MDKFYRKSNKKVLMFIIAILFIYSYSTTALVYSYYQKYQETQEKLIELNTTIEQQQHNALGESNTEEIEDTSIYAYQDCSIPVGHTSFRSWMPSSSLNKDSIQWQYVTKATPDENGLLKIDEYYCVAMGTYYGGLGDTFKITTDTGSSFKVIITDIKADIHTDSLNQYTVANGCMLEFVVDKDQLNTSIQVSGCVNTDIISGKIIKVEKEVPKVNE